MPRSPRVVADFIAYQGHDAILQRGYQHASWRSGPRRIACVIDHLDDHVLGVDVIAAGGTFPGEESLGRAVVVGDRAAEGAGEFFAQRISLIDRASRLGRELIEHPSLVAEKS